MKRTTTIKRRRLIVPFAVDSSHGDSGWKTTLFNCYCHSFEEVVRHIMRATRCSLDRSLEITAAAENKGSAIVCEGTKDYCEKIARMLGGGGLTVTVTKNE